jgi:hypothetical protein
VRRPYGAEAVGSEASGSHHEVSFYVHGAVSAFSGQVHCCPISLTNASPMITRPMTAPTQSLSTDPVYRQGSLSYPELVIADERGVSTSLEKSLTSYTGMTGMTGSVNAMMAAQLSPAWKAMIEASAITQIGSAFNAMMDAQLSPVRKAMIEASRIGQVAQSLMQPSMPNPALYGVKASSIISAHSDLAQFADNFSSFVTSQVRAVDSTYRSSRTRHDYTRKLASVGRLVSLGSSTASFMSHSPIASRLHYPTTEELQRAAGDIRTLFRSDAALQDPSIDRSLNVAE